MEFLVTMTTHVPDGTSDAAVEDVRAREAAHSRELAAQGICSGCGGLPCCRANGGPSASSRPPTAPRSRQCSSPCLSGCGAPTRSPLSRPIPTTRARQPRERHRRTRRRGERVLHHLHDHGPARNAEAASSMPPRRSEADTSKGAGRARKAPTALGAVRRGPGARTVAGPRRRRRCRRSWTPSPPSLGRGGDRPARSAPQRPRSAPALTPGGRHGPQDRKVAIVTGASQGIGAGIVAGYREKDWAVVATARTIEAAGDPAILAVARGHVGSRHRGPDRRRGLGDLRPDRHPRQQRRRLPLQALHRLHGRRLRRGGRRQSHRVLSADAARHHPHAGERHGTRRQHHDHPGRRCRLHGPVRAHRAHQGWRCCRDQVARH